MIEILDFIEEHKKAVIAVAVMILCIIISGSVAGKFAKSGKAAADDLARVENNIANVEEQLNNPVTRYRELDHGYHKSRVDSDIRTLEGRGTGNGNTNEWLSCFLTWTSGKEYTENRDWFVEKLGSGNVFCTEVMRPYETGTRMDGDTALNLDEVECTLRNTEFYVDSIDESTGTYNYVIFAYFDAKKAFENRGFDAIDKVQCYIIRVSTDRDGNVIPDTFNVTAGPAANIY